MIDQNLPEDIKDFDPALTSDTLRRAQDFTQLRPLADPRPAFLAALRKKVLQPAAEQANIYDKKENIIHNFISMWGKRLMWGGAAVLAVAVIMITMSRPSSALGAELAYAEGAVLYRTGGGVWQEAEEGTTLKEGDGVKVIGIGRAVILLDDGSAVRLNNDSEATLSALEPEHMQIINEYGQVYTRVVKSKSRAFDVNVKGTLYRALGTAYMTVNTDETQGVEVYHSAVQVIDPESANEADEAETKAVVTEGSAYYEVNVEAPKKVEEVTAIDTTEAESDDFVVWNKEQDVADDKFEDQLGVLAVVAIESDPAVAESEVVVAESETAASETPAAGTDIVLSPVGANALSWTKPAGIGSNGFKVVYSKNTAPSYPARERDKAIYVDAGTIIPWLYAFDGSGTYHVRVCDYLPNGSCGKYSNEATIALTADSQPVKVAVSEVREEVKEMKNDAKEAVNEVKTVVKNEIKDKMKEQYPGTPAESGVSKITLVADSPEPEHVSWTVEGSLAAGMERGVRVVFSKNPNPTYGTNLALPVGYKNYAKIYAKEGAGTYHVRVCEFLGDRCGTYSNEVTVNIKGSGAGGEYLDNGEWKSSRTSSGAAGSTVSNISVTANDPASEHVSWSVVGTWVQGMDRGFRVLYSKNPNPTLGGSGVMAQPVGYKRYTKLWPKSGVGTYYVRVCEYLGNNACGTYSNEITINVTGAGSEYKGDRMMEYAN